MTRRGWQVAAPLAVAALSLAAGAFLHLVGAAVAGDAVWGIGVAVVLVPLAAGVVGSLRRGDVGVDLIALLAMAGALALGEYLAAIVVAVMLAGGNALEAYASRRAGHALRALLERAPTDARRRGSDGTLETVAVDDVVAGDVVVVRRGEVVPVDGTLTSPAAVVDESALTGEPLPAMLHAGDAVRSGTANAGEAFELRADRAASESAYAGIVRLVRAAAEERAPFVRMADRFAVVMLVGTLLLGGLGWLVSGDPVRAVAVLVVATPCPLILAAPIALISGVARAARLGVIVKGGSVVERLAAARTVLLDKTGTLTRGHPELERVVALDGLAPDDILRLAASVEQYSVHVTAEAIVRAARDCGLRLTDPTQVTESPGEGVDGEVEGRRVVAGSGAFLDAHGVATAGVPLDGRPGLGEACVLVGVDGTPAGSLVLTDRIRPDAPALVARLRSAGVRHIALASGDRQAVADAVGGELGLDAAYGDQTPAAKLALVRSLRAERELRPVVMVGDGINDAPALAIADVGIALGAGGATVASQTADAVIAVDRVDRVADAIEISSRAMRIARQSVVAGLALSIGGMAAAAAGLLPPVAGALFQEAIDVAVILNALRALR